jgi:hypothetical protein
VVEPIPIRVVNRVYVLPEDFWDRLPNDQRREQMTSFRDCGEWEEVLRYVVGGLEETQAPVTSEERDELRELLEALKMPTFQVERLHVVDPT